MPMNFPDLNSLKRVAKNHGFREFDEDTENEEEYRLSLAKHVRNRDRVESFEIQFGISWDKWTSKQQRESLFGR